MADDLQLNFGDAAGHTAHDLASMEGVDLFKTSPATARLWEARGLALHHLAAGDMVEALKVMEAARPAGRRFPTPATRTSRRPEYIAAAPECPAAAPHLKRLPTRPRVAHFR